MSFINDDFILTNETAKKLYHDYAEKMPIIDYHCHINPKEIYENKKFKNITEIWLGGDHYKWRLIRSNGTPENEITGDADDYTKFLRFAEMLPRAIGNPMYHWNHLELKRYFDYDGILSAKTAEEVWNLCNEKLASDDMSACNIIKKSNVKMIGTTDDPIDTLEYHDQIKDDETFDVQVLPAWRPDKAMNLEADTYFAYLAELSRVSGIEINTFADLKAALRDRMEYFAAHGCSVSDHGLVSMMYVPASDEEIEAIFAKRLSGQTITYEEELKFKTAYLVFMGREYTKLNWVMQLHYGCKRNNNIGMFKKIGPDTGFDCIYTDTSSKDLADFLGALQETNELPKTIIYSLNPTDDTSITTVMGCFQGNEEGIVNKIQHGSAWWFNDNKTGMFNQMINLANEGLLGNFNGMLTDSRSFLSYTRHEYFRRILCELVGTWVENGEYPADMENLSELVKNISYNNAIRYFNFDLETK